MHELSEEEATAADADEDDDFDPTADEDAAGGGGSSGGLNVVGKRWRGQNKPSSYRGTATSALKRIHTLEDGTVVFKDELEKIEDQVRKAEKRRLAEEAKKKKDEDAKRKAEEEAAAAAASPAPTDPSPSSAKSKPPVPSKPFVFEVVVPFAAKAVAPKAAAAAAAASSLALKAARASPAVSSSSPATLALKNSNSFSALTLDDFVTPSAPVMNAWGTGVIPVAAAPKPMISVTFKPAKSKPVQAAPEEDEWEPEPAAARSQEEIAAGRAAKAALKQARKEAREKAAAEAAEAEAKVQAELEARAAAELEAEDAAAEAVRAEAAKIAEQARRERNEGKESDVEPSQSPKPTSETETEAEAEAESEPEAEAEPEPSVAAAAAESDAELEALNEPGAAPKSSSASPTVSTPVVSSRASPAITPSVAAPPAIEYKSLLYSQPSSAPLSAINSPEKFAANSSSPLRMTPHAPVTASPMKLSSTPAQRQALAAITAAPHPAASSSSASSMSARASAAIPSAASLAAAQLAWQRQQLESTALRVVPFAQMRAATRAAALVKAPAPVAAPLASPPVVARPAAIAMVDSIAESYAGEPTAILLVRRLPAAVSSEMLGSLFCCFGRLRVQQLYTLATDSNGGAGGLTGVLHFHTIEAAAKARASMQGRVYDLTSTHENSPNQVSSPPAHRWQLDAADIVFAHAPLTTRPAPATVVKLVGYNRGQDACANVFNRQHGAGAQPHAQSMFMFA